MSVRAPTAKIRRGLPVLGALIATLALAACGSSGAKNTTTVSIRTTPATSTQTTAGRSDLDTPQSSGDVTLRVTKVNETGSLTYLAGTRSAVTPTGAAKTTPAPHNFGYVAVTATVTNHTTAALNLACGTALTVALGDDKANTYTPVEGLSQISGNPSCAQPLKAGASTAMTWVFLASKMGTINAFEFAAAGHTARPTVVTL